MYNARSIYIIILILLTVDVSAQKKTEILLLGTFHFDSPNLDLVKTTALDIDAVQAELENITAQIVAFGPTKIFVEWDFDKQSELDSLYTLYLANRYFDVVKERHPDQKFYRNSEIFQLAFRVAKKSGHRQLYGIDIKTEFPFAEVMAAIKEAGQAELAGEIQEKIAAIAKKEADDRKKYTLQELLLLKNTPEARREDYSAYISLFNRAGRSNDFQGSRLVGEWYRRNLLMYSFVQKALGDNDERVMVLLGSGHAAIIAQLVEFDDRASLVPVHKVLK